MLSKESLRSLADLGALEKQVQQAIQDCSDLFERCELSYQMIRFIFEEEDSAEEHHMFQLDTSRTVGAIGTTLMIHIKVHSTPINIKPCLGQPSPKGSLTGHLSGGFFEPS